MDEYIDSFFKDLYVFYINTNIEDTVSYEFFIRDIPLYMFNVDINNIMFKNYSILGMVWFDYIGANSNHPTLQHFITNYSYLYGYEREINNLLRKEKIERLLGYGIH